MSEATPGGEGVSVSAPAKLTLSLRVTGVRDDGYHLLDAEMVSIDLADTLTFGTGTGISVVDDVRGHLGVGGVPTGPENLVARALTLVGRRASVRIVKRIPAGAGLGGGSSDAAAVLRWAESSDPALAARLGSDVPFCVRGGHARVTGAGERLEPLPFEDRRFVLLLSPLSVDTDAVYRRWDDRRARHGAEEHHAGPGGNDLEAAALEVAPQLAHWRRELAVVTGRTPRLAGSGSTWFVEGDAEGLGIAGLDFLVMGDQRAVLVEVSTLPATSSR
ncbi:MAG TPA: 4-(cytidine 5'-diphospho)-2-C-methyl-D-erythritol kinase [Acidimicrobiales bacterium]|nr:4-(cytidine 5'-diphospho)-2-C-methyl-D-erythritol kinase [Acidimicrobiales bacterium]